MLQPPHNNAATEVEALFFAESLARKQNLYEVLKQSRMRLAGPIGLTEAKLLRSEIQSKTQANLLGKELSIFKWINPVEREVLECMDKPLTLAELLEITKKINIQDEDVIIAVRSLIRNEFIMLTLI